MRVGFFMQDLPPETGGGHTFELDALNALLRNRGQSSHAFVVLCHEATAAWVRENFGADVDIEVLPHAGRASLLRDAALRCMQSLRATFGGASPLDRIARAARLDFIWFAGSGTTFTNLPYLTVVWDLQHRSTPWFPEFSGNGTWDRREMTLWFLRRASAVITGTQVGRDELTKWIGVPDERILVLPHPTPSFARVPQAQAVPAMPPSLSTKRRFLFYPAQFWPHKNHVNLILGFAQAVRRHGVDFDLVLCGADKGNRKHVERCIATERMQDRVHIIGFVSRDELVSLYRNAIALTYLSWGGPENLPPLEAFALGCPVIAARVPGADEQLGDAALLVDPAAPSQIAEAIAQLHDSTDLRAELAKRGQLRAERWSGDDYVHGVFAFLNRFEAIARCWARDTD